MNSPFPGMDPYLELHWRSVHHRLITYAGDRLQEALPRQFRVEVEERVFVAGGDYAGRSIFPDVYVVERQPPVPAVAGGVVVADPVIIDLPEDPVTEIYLEIIDTLSGNTVVTAIEFLSPTNKTAGDGNDMYLRKQREYRAARVSQVEIDLTRDGNRSLVLPMARIPPNLRATYLGCVRRGWRPLRIETYPMPLGRPLPLVAVPLDESTGDVTLDLQGILTDCYRNGRYDDIDYRADPLPPLQAEESAWADNLLRLAGRR